MEGSMLNLRKNRKGFTLLEVLIVLVILAVLAGLAIPAYQTAVEKSRAQEALQGLSAARESMMRYFAINSTYADQPGYTIAADLSSGVDYNPNLAVGGQLPIFTYAVAGRTAATFTITATRTGGPIGTISVNHAGLVVKTGVYA